MSLVDLWRKTHTIGATAVVMLLTLTSCQHAKDDQTPQAPQIPFERYVLDNGLTVILHEDHSDPVVHVDVTYHVGSAREELGKSGFAHLFEHMMFQGSENVADEEHIKSVTETGGTMNGTTNRDRTNYFQTVPSNHLETMLWLEADRMGFFLEGITQEKFEIQRATVKNEKQQNYDNRAYGRAFELITKTLYPYGHPYSWLTIGDLEDLDRATAEDLKNFFLKWYGPNNATLTIGGAIEPNEVLPMVEKYFGGIAKGPKIEPLNIPSFELEQDRYVSYYDDKVHFPAVTLSFPTVEKLHPDAAALSGLAGILGAGKGSYLYKNFIDNQKAISASASHRSDELGGEFFMFVLPYPGVSLSDFEKDLRDSFDEFELNGVSDGDLQKFKARYETAFISGLEKVSGKVSKLAYYETFANDASKASEELDAYLAVTKDDIMRVYKKYIKNKPSVVLSILADPDGKPARPDNFTIPKEGPNPYPKTDYSNLEYKKAEDNFDRSIKPKAQKAALAKPPAYWQAELANGIEVMGSEQRELPKVYFSIRTKGGNILDQNKPDQLGITSLSTAMLNTSTVNYTEAEIAEELEKLGSKISFSSSDLYFNIDVSTLSKHLDKTIDVLEEKLRNPAFLEKDFARLKQQTLESAKSSTKQASSIASIAWNRLLYDADHFKGTPITHSIPTVSKLNHKDAEQFYNTYFSMKGAEIVVVGDIDKKAFLPKIEFLTELNSPDIDRPKTPKTPEYEKTTLFFIDKPDAAQSEIRVGYLSDLLYNPVGEFYKRFLMNFTLGGAFNSRINLNLREEKGLSYGAGSYFSGSELPGPFTAYSSVKRDGTDIALAEILREISNIRAQGITDQELTFLKNAIGQRDALKYESNSQKAGFLSYIQRYNVPKDFVETRQNIINNLTTSEVQKLAQTHLPMDKMSILVVGDKAKIYEKLSALGYDIVELNEEGGPI